MKYLLVLFIILVTGCQTIPDNASTERHAIAVLPFSFIWHNSMRNDAEYRGINQFHLAHAQWYKITTSTKNNILLSAYFDQANSQCKINTDLITEQLSKLQTDVDYFNQFPFKVALYYIDSKNFDITHITHLNNTLKFYFRLDQCNQKLSLNQILDSVKTVYHELTHLYVESSNLSLYSSTVADEYLASRVGFCTVTQAPNNITYNFPKNFKANDLQRRLETMLQGYQLADFEYRSFAGYRNVDIQLFELFKGDFDNKTAENRKKIKQFCAFKLEKTNPNLFFKPIRSDFFKNRIAQYNKSFSLLL